MINTFMSHNQSVEVSHSGQEDFDLLNAYTSFQIPLEM